MVPTIASLFLAVAVAPQPETGPDLSEGMPAVVSTAVFVREGEAVGVIERGARWEQNDDHLLGSGVGNHLLADRAIGEGDFRIEVELAIERLEGTAASLVFGGSHVGFDGRSGGMFLEGPLFGGGVSAPDVAWVVPEDEPFRVVVTRRDGVLSVSVGVDSVGDESIHRSEVGSDALGPIGLRPWRATMRVHEFSATGSLEALPTLSGPWTSGRGGYHTYRIPAFVVTGAGSILAFCEGRRDGGGDSGDIDLLMRRSDDGGETWSEQRVLWDDGPNCCGNPCPVVDHETGTVHLLMTRNLGQDHESEIIAGTSEGTRTVWVMSSADDGLTWSAPRDITATAKRADWTWYATGPGVGIQVRRGEHRGRLVIPCDHIEADSKRYLSHVIFSDDHGETWQLGGSSPVDQVNECQVVELSSGELMLNMRNYDRSQRTRAVCISSDGGRTWSGFRHDPALIEPICQAGLVRIDPESDDDARIVFSNPASRSSRTAMTLRLSEDDGATWSNALRLHSGPSAYSCVQILPGGRVGCLFEAGILAPYETLAFRVVALDEIRG